MDDSFYNYKEDKWLWFYIYLELASTICEYPSLSVKNSDFKDNLDKLDIPIDWGGKGKYSYGTK